LTHEELVREMSAARKRREEQTARAIRDARVLAVRAAVPPGAGITEIEERARSFYPRLSQELVEELASIVVDQQGSRIPAVVPEIDLDDVPLELDEEAAPEL
jgi:hypothetical protein